MISVNCLVPFVQQLCCSYQLASGQGMQCNKSLDRILQFDSITFMTYVLDIDRREQTMRRA